MSPERLIGWVIGAIIAILLVAVGAWVFNSSAARNAEIAVLHTRDVESAIRSFLIGMQDIETGYRGFLITGQDAFLQPFESGKRDAPAALETVKNLTSDNPAQAGPIIRLRELMRQKVALGDRVIQVRRSEGGEAASEIIAVGDGKMLMDAIRQIAKQMQAIEGQLLDERSRIAAQRHRQVSIASVATAIILIVAMVAFMMGLRRQTIVRAEITQNLKQTESNLRRSLEQLGRSNRDLQDFAMVASHDLQEPLRKIQMFGDRLRDELGGGVAPQALDYLQRMQSAADRGQLLIRGLLAYSRIASQGQPLVDISLDTVAREVLGDLEGRLADTSGRVEIIGKLPTLEADPVQMRQLLQNLISNALKFRRPDVAPVIRVSANAIDEPGKSGWWQLEVADNGIGFEEKYLDRIFKIFQRLHERGLYDGAGMGLAICRRIVERHQGVLTARSVPGQGSTFIIQLPPHQTTQEASV